ncbi:YkgJ family cysteine cluster protein [Clostridium pasteurianum]|uniref:Putative Fe-S oxidoreductase n=1 Tax=Clostridium pasteurianum BC1 TaxID=86416 RepID=R4KG43_CLOPA|nr:YkgJ family cysteine cluster protein [Clostridium pasteurianum]AGK98575.1 putative Fe-S oxidoreductase [Clostridium pasteurianum BC1]
MIEPSKIEEEFKKAEDENYAFRTYLKNHADSDELDEQFAKLHSELFHNYDCNKCRNCCKIYSITFEETEIESAAKLLKMTKGEFMNKHIEMTANGYEVKGKPCYFLSESGICKIESCKPEGYRDYPFTNKPERLFSLYSIIGSAGVCPVVFEILERLKKMYNFKRRKRN